jgi:hypothetical protein
VPGKGSCYSVGCFCATEIVTVTVGNTTITIVNKPLPVLVNWYVHNRAIVLGLLCFSISFVCIIKLYWTYRVVQARSALLDAPNSVNTAVDSTAILLRKLTEILTKHD